MKVYQLQELLSQLPQDADVVLPQENEQEAEPVTIDEFQFHDMLDENNQKIGYKLVAIFSED